jgi:hypothetical protein
MKFRKFLASLFSPPQPVRRPPTDPVQQLEQDAHEILDRIYTGKPRTRAALAGVMSQPRWQAAIHLLKSAGILDERGICRLSAQHLSDGTAGVLIRSAINERKRLARMGNYVSPD